MKHFTKKTASAPAKGNTSINTRRRDAALRVYALRLRISARSFLSLVAVATMGSLGWALFGPLSSIATITFATALCLYAQEEGSRAQAKQVAHLEQTLRGYADNIYFQAETLTTTYRMVDQRFTLPPLRHWALSPDAASAMTTLALSQQPKRILELGSGASTILLASLLRMFGTGHLISIEHDPVFTERTKERLAEAGLSHFAEVRYASLLPLPLSAATPSLDIAGEDDIAELSRQGRHLLRTESQTENEQERIWYDLSAFTDISDIDLLVVDGPPHDTCTDARMPALSLLHHKLSPTAHIFLDDTGREDEQRMIKAWEDAFPDLVFTDLFTEKGNTLGRREA